MNNQFSGWVVSFRFRVNVVIITRILKSIVTVVKLFYGLLMQKNIFVQVLFTKVFKSGSVAKNYRL